MEILVCIKQFLGTTQVEIEEAHPESRKGRAVRMTDTAAKERRET